MSRSGHHSVKKVHISPAIWEKLVIFFDICQYSWVVRVVQVVTVVTVVCNCWDSCKRVVDVVFEAVPLVMVFWVVILVAVELIVSNKLVSVLLFYFSPNLLFENFTIIFFCMFLPFVLIAFLSLLQKRIFSTSFHYLSIEWKVKIVKIHHRTTSLDSVFVY